MTKKLVALWSARGEMVTGQTDTCSIIFYFFGYPSLSFSIFRYPSLSFGNLSLSLTIFHYLLAILHYFSLSLGYISLSFGFLSLSLIIVHYLSLSLTIFWLSFAIRHYLLAIPHYLSLSFGYLLLSLTIFHYPKTKEYFTETKIFMGKVRIVFKNLLQSSREKINIEKVLHEKLKLNIANQNNF